MKSASQRKQERIELKPDAWPHFERFIRGIAKAGPQHRKGKPNKGESTRSRKERKKKKASA